MAKATWLNVGGIWYKVKNLWQNIGGSWKQKEVPMLNVSSEWKKCMSYILSTTTQIFNKLNGTGTYEYVRDNLWVSTNNVDILFESYYSSHNAVLKSRIDWADGNSSFSCGMAVHIAKGYYDSGNGWDVVFIAWEDSSGKWGWSKLKYTSDRKLTVLLTSSFYSSVSYGMYIVYNAGYVYFTTGNALQQRSEADAVIKYGISCGYPWDMKTDGTYIYILTSSNMIQKFDMNLNLISTLTDSTHLTGVHKLALTKNYIAVLNTNTIVLYDYSFNFIKSISLTSIATGGMYYSTFPCNHDEDTFYISYEKTDSKYYACKLDSNGNVVYEVGDGKSGTSSYASIGYDEVNHVLYYDHVYYTIAYQES